MGISHGFVDEIRNISNSRQSKCIVLTGNVDDLFYVEGDNKFSPLSPFLISNWDSEEHRQGLIKIVYEVNGGICFTNDEDVQLVKDAWLKFHTGIDSSQDLAIRKLVHTGFDKSLKKIETLFEEVLKQTQASSAVALEFLRQLCLISRIKIKGSALLQKKLLIFVEGAHMLIPPGEIARLSDADRTRVAVCKDWFSDPEFLDGKDSVLLISESRSKLNEEIARLPSLLTVEIASPDFEIRKEYIRWFNSKLPDNNKLKLWDSQKAVASVTAGLSIQSIKQLLEWCSYEKKTLQPEDCIDKVAEFLESQLGEGVVEFYVPTHTLKDVIGNRSLKKFLIDYLIPRIKKGGKTALSGIAVAGAIGSGKTFIFDAVAAQLGMPVIVLKNLRSKWFGETDVIFERLVRCLIALDKAVIYMDEADTQLGNLNADAHPTERRLTGNIQKLMSDTRFLGKILWILMSARIDMLSADLRRPGRAGDLIIPVLDPEDDDLIDFVKWMIKSVVDDFSDELFGELYGSMKGYYAAAFASLRRDLIYAAGDGKLSEEQIRAVINDRILPDSSARIIQELQAKLNCTHRSLLPNGQNEDIEKLHKMWRNSLMSLV